ncbi:MAG: TnpV protein [Eubacteriales bacterium]|nr:TnpV protein [Eubacteriales bacterium]
MKLTYTQTGDYLIPNLILEDQTQAVPGKYGMLRKTYLKNHRGGTYQTLLLSGKLNAHLLEIDQTANQRMEEILNRLLQTNPAPDKADDPIAWTAHLNNLTQMAKETILKELIYS